MIYAKTLNQSKPIDQLPWPSVDDIFVCVEFNGVMSLEEAFAATGISTELVPSESKVEVIHRSAFHDPSQLELMQGPGHWFWRWKSLPEHVGRPYAFATPLAAAHDALCEEAAWMLALQKEGMSAEEWKTWKPGQVFHRT